MFNKVVSGALILSTAVILHVHPAPVLAQNYGEGAYGAAEYNNNVAPTSTQSSSSSSGSSSSSAPTCQATQPGEKAVWLYAAIPKSSGSIELYFTDAQEPYDHYAIEYGTESGTYTYGAVNIGGRGIRTYTVESLSPNTTYYFRIRPGNGCAPGPWSNEISAKTSGLISTTFLEISSSELKTSDRADEDADTGKDSCTTYTVKPGDALWNIAQAELGDGNRYREIIEGNKEMYPSLTKSNTVRTGWQLTISCETQNENAVGEDEEQAGYEVNVKVMDEEKKPVAGAEVTLHSTPRTAITDTKGIASFTNVEPGQHRVVIAYGDYQGEQSVNLEGDVKVFDLNVTVEQKDVIVSKSAWVIIGILSAVIIILTLAVFWYRRRR